MLPPREYVLLGVLLVLSSSLINRSNIDLWSDLTVYVSFFFFIYIYTAHSHSCVLSGWFDVKGNGL